eukprot:CAMPEP_0183356368 /NCGR_PEP_ID=MMETSP0164_2-20130417/44156_1 /TAXON_ID=221442 /ORGANISM="Coccolithus pelagicus ssp braarudi, Strain PLY182g" /LENGTH=84 /DNA_ID=CAMNT_0025529763 /DNA_START=16 /DNA_END=266 /DNA_ORIENTATION=-
MNLEAATDVSKWSAVKAAFEDNYDCLGVACSDIGGIWSSTQGKYYANAEPCADEPYESIAGYVPASQVTDHNAMDLDQQAMETA